MLAGVAVGSKYYPRGVTSALWLLEKNKKKRLFTPILSDAFLAHYYELCRVISHTSAHIRRAQRIGLLKLHRRFKMRGVWDVPLMFYHV